MTKFTNPIVSLLMQMSFDALHLTQGERDGVYEAVVNLVESRLRKAEKFEREIIELIRCESFKILLTFVDLIQETVTIYGVISG